MTVINGMTVTASQLADLTFTSALNDSTDSSFTYTVNDAGAGVTAAIMNITVNAVNDAPSFTTLGNQIVAENSGAQTVAGFASPTAGGGPDESGQTFNYTVSNDNPTLFGVAPSIDANGQLTYTLAVGQSGTATVTVSVTDSGGTANSGVESSPDQTFDISVTANAAPTTTGISDVTVNCPLMPMDS